MPFRPRRSVLYMPGSNARAIEKARTLPADCIVLDLEDSVAPETKAAARVQVGEAVKAGGFGPREVVVRNVANLVPPYSPDGLYHGVSAALEYGVTVLRVKHLVVLGHARCGGIQAYASNGPTGDFIGKWISLLAPAAASVHDHKQGDDYLRRLEQASLKRSLDNLKTFPFIRTATESNALALFGAYFDVATGELSVLEGESGQFVAVAGD